MKPCIDQFRCYFKSKKKIILFMKKKDSIKYAYTITYIHYITGIIMKKGISR